MSCRQANWFAVRAGGSRTDVWPDIGLLFAPVQMVHRSGDLSDMYTCCKREEGKTCVNTIPVGDQWGRCMDPGLRISPCLGPSLRWTRTDNTLSIGRRGSRAAQADLCSFWRCLCCRRPRCLLRFLCCILQFLSRTRCCLLHPLTLEHLREPPSVLFG
jgi:hypothetical protein